MFWFKKKEAPADTIPSPEEFLGYLKLDRHRTTVAVKELQSKIYAKARLELVQSMQNGHPHNNICFTTGMQGKWDDIHAACNLVAASLQEELREVGYSKARVEYKDNTRLYYHLGGE